ncbi:hypothetical protein JQ543_16210 [Bradyrhizobium diazoefficiens]|nr:hypothetical protein [Bradyrhizobium diazoefficiens]MBR0849298.1 hypothetical protein [Bradyrhizobium diazoefficiens]
MRRSLEIALAQHGKPLRPCSDAGPLVRAVDREALKREFYNTVIVGSETETNRNDAKKKAFSRALKEALSYELIGSREVAGEMLFWLAAPMDAADDVT